MSDHHTNHSSPEDDYRVTPAGAGYEHTDADTGPILRFLAWLGVLIIFTVVFTYGLFKGYIWGFQSTTPAQYPLAVTQGPRMPPEPRLQANPVADLKAFRKEEDEILNSYAWVDRANGTVRLPIEEAMHLAIEKSLRGRPAAQAVEGITGLEDTSATPSDASSGRVLERRRQ